jgi:hypothetical protein
MLSRTFIKIMQMESVERRVIDAFREAIGEDSNVSCLHAPRASHGVAQAAVHSQLASQGTGVVIFRDADMYRSSCY